MKKDKYYEIAEKMYTELFITVAGIAKRLGVNERTIKRWKKDGNWTEKRYQYLYKHGINICINIQTLKMIFIYFVKPCLQILIQNFKTARK